MGFVLTCAPLGELVLFALCTGNTGTIFLEEEFLSSLIKNFLFFSFFFSKKVQD